MEFNEYLLRCKATRDLRWQDGYGLVRTWLRGTKRGRRASKGLGTENLMLGEKAS
jgi:hypothetical protein